MKSKQSVHIKVKSQHLASSIMTPHIKSVVTDHCMPLLRYGQFYKPISTRGHTRGFETQLLARLTDCELIARGQVKNATVMSFISLRNIVIIPAATCIIDLYDVKAIVMNYRTCNYPGSCRSRVDAAYVDPGSQSNPCCPVNSRSNRLGACAVNND